MAESVTKPLSFFKESRNVRKGMNEASLRELGESMLQDGQLQDVIAQPDGTLIFGHRRLAAAKLVGGIESLTVKIVENAIEAGKVLILQAVENEQRENLTDFERWRMVEELRQLYPKWMAKDLAEALHKDSPYITRYQSPSKCIPAVQEAFEAGRLGISSVYNLSRSSEKEQHELLAMKLGGASRDDLVRSVQRRKRPTNGVRTGRLSCPLPSGITVTLSGIEIGMDEGIEALTAAAKEMKKALSEGLDAKTAQAVWRDRARKETADV
jgi:ParB family transcriptional regulator, chromosome partitioning protein